ncbi:MAG: MBL fold metallo-hydrolase [Niabella sp.]
MTLYSINCGHFKLDGGAMFGVVPKSIWKNLTPADENNLCSLATRSLLIEDDKRLMLIDTGLGTKQSEKFFGFYYLHGDDSLQKSLVAHGFHPDDITDVFLTHLHFDHCGGAIQKDGDKFIPTFKNATYWSNHHHWGWALNPNPRERPSFLKENITPIRDSGQLKYIDEEIHIDGKLDTADLCPHCRVRFVNGHTNAMMLPQITYKNRTIVFVADLFPSVAHLPVNYVPAYDIKPLVSMTEKEQFLQEALANDYILFFEHDPVNECCTLQQTEKGIRAKDIFKLSEL